MVLSILWAKIMPNKAKQLINMIADGRYKDITIKIPVEDLYQMFIRNQDKLKKLIINLRQKNTNRTIFNYRIYVCV